MLVWINFLFFSLDARAFTCTEMEKTNKRMAVATEKQMRRKREGLLLNQPEDEGLKETIITRASMFTRQRFLPISKCSILLQISLLMSIAWIK